MKLKQELVQMAQEFNIKEDKEFIKIYNQIIEECKKEASKGLYSKEIRLEKLMKITRKEKDYGGHYYICDFKLLNKVQRMLLDHDGINCTRQFNVPDMAQVAIFLYW